MAAVSVRHNKARDEVIVEFRFHTDESPAYFVRYGREEALELGAAIIAFATKLDPAPEKLN